MYCHLQIKLLRFSVTDFCFHLPRWSPCDFKWGITAGALACLHSTFPISSVLKQGSKSIEYHICRIALYWNRHWAVQIVSRPFKPSLMKTKNDVCQVKYPLWLDVAEASDFLCTSAIHNAFQAEIITHFWLRNFGNWEKLILRFIYNFPQRRFKTIIAQ